jgi:beta-phosphoglucomutase family hydrolase
MFELPEWIKGLVFDCDGTIADTMPLHYQAWSAALKTHGADFPEAMFYDFAGVPTRKIIEILNEKHGYSLPVDEATNLKESMFEELIPQTKPVGPVVDLIRQYSGKLPMSVATGGTRSLVTKTLTALNLLDKFEAMVTADDVLHGKPAPDIFLEAAQRIGVPPGECAAFEDGELGLQSAIAAGMLVVDVRVMKIVHDPRK